VVVAKVVAGVVVVGVEVVEVVAPGGGWEAAPSSAHTSLSVWV
jgi:hypothetical protein